jgi:hypothetical protein
MGKVDLNLKKLLGFKIVADDKSASALSSAKIGTKTDISPADVTKSDKAR